MLSSNDASLNLSVIITAHNEGDEVNLTIDSIRDVQTEQEEIVIVDDASTDGSTTSISQSSNTTIIRRDQRVGVAISRHEATEFARGNVYGFLDAHQRIEGNSLKQCSALALRKNAIVCPDTSTLDGDTRWHGAYFSIDKKSGYFSAEWKLRKPIGRYGQVSSLKAPAYFIPKVVYPRVRWNRMQRGWGGSEAMVSVKAFFAGVPILHLCGPLIRHKFKPKFHYDVGWDEVWRNQAIIARTCFDDATWKSYWLPQVFDGHLSAETLTEMDSEEMNAERVDFSRYKVRSDKEFWTDLLYREPPPTVRCS